MKVRISKEKLCEALYVERSDLHDVPEIVELEAEPVEQHPQEHWQYSPVKLDDEARTKNCGCECHEKFTYKSHGQCCFQLKPFITEENPALIEELDVHRIKCGDGSVEAEIRGLAWKLNELIRAHNKTLVGPARP